ncbi:MAG: F0F1 ATP synthase subunit delta [bacterium]
MKLTPTLRQDLKNFLKARLVDQSVMAQVYAPYMLSTDEVKQIQSKYEILKGAQVTAHVDPTLLAGFVVEVGSKRIDCSLKSRLNTIFV